MPLHCRDEMTKLVDDMQQQEIIQPSQSPWASPVVLVQKKDGSTRFCVDYRRLNRSTKKDCYPLPRVDDILDTLAEAQWFSTIDLASGYWQVEVQPDDREKTAFEFVTQQGLYEFRVMPFGLCNAPSTFQHLMELVLAGLQWESCLVHIDDIAVYGQTIQEHLQRLQRVMERLREAHQKINPKKCKLFQRSASFLGHTISGEGVSTDESKVECIEKWPMPNNTQELCSFLGLAAYYRCFVNGFADIASPLYALLQKSTFHWTEQCDQAFKRLKRSLVTSPVLTYPQVEGTFTLDTDASQQGIGGVYKIQNGVERVLPMGAEHSPKLNTTTA